jgi:anaerobic selenocysteine-containing dehydrogenase
MADIVLPAASSWESWHVGAVIAPRGDKGYIQLRPEVSPPRYECRSDMEVIFDLAKRLGLGEHFWNGDVESGFNYQFTPSGITVDDLKKNPGGICVELDMQYRKYKKINAEGHYSGLSSPSKRVEIYSMVFKERGYDPLPSWKDPATIFPEQVYAKEKYPLLLTCGKIVEFCHSQHRALPSLRKRVPHPFLEINPDTAITLDITDDEWVLVETPHGSITLKAKLNDGIAADVVSTQNGWWQGCSALEIAGYDPYSSKGSNINLLFNTKEKDPISGSLHIKGHPCAVKKIEKKKK